jgi:hypothetical protein
MPLYSSSPSGLRPDTAPRVDSGGRPQALDASAAAPAAMAPRPRNRLRVIVLFFFMTVFS